MVLPELLVPKVLPEKMVEMEPLVQMEHKEQQELLALLVHKVQLVLKE